MVSGISGKEGEECAGLAIGCGLRVGERRMGVMMERTLSCDLRFDVPGYRFAIVTENVVWNGRGWEMGR